MRAQQGHSSRFVVVPVTLAVLCTGRLGAQTMAVEEARRISARAQELTDQRQWNEALELVQTGLRRTGRSAQAAPSSGILNFSLGYVYQRMAEQESDRRVRQRWLESALQAYERAWDALPGNAQIMSNRVVLLKRLGKWEDAARLLERTADSSAGRGGSYLIAAGDLYLEQNRAEDALQCYEAVAASSPEDETPAWKILNVYRSDKGAPAERLLAYSHRLAENGQEGPARDGFEQVIKRCFAGQPTLAEDALVAWAELGARHGWIGPESLRLLPAESEWNTPLIRELRLLIDDPERNGRRLEQWRFHPLRRHVAASVLESLAKDMSAGGRVESAINVCTAALDIAPEPAAYGRGAPLEGKPIVTLEVQSELASLYVRHPSLDRDGSKLAGVIAQLFERKGEAYRDRSLAAIERYHTMLGLIYAEQGRWLPRGHADGAIFQLEKAIETAQLRVQENPEDFTPLPHLHRLLANGYASTGREPMAFASYVDSAMGCLDLDDLGKAEEMLKRAETLRSAAPTEHREKARLTATILRARQSVPRLSPAAFEPDNPQYYAKQASFQWMRRGSVAPAHQPFVNRQRFKICADSGRRASQVGKPGESLRLQTEALKAIQQEPALINMDDVVRVRRARDAVLEHVHVDSEPRALPRGRALSRVPSPKDEKVWSVSTVQTVRGVGVGVSRDLLLAGAVANRLSSDPSFVSGEIELYLSGGNATIVPVRGGVRPARESVKALRDVEGLRRIAVKEKQ